MRMRARRGRRKGARCEAGTPCIRNNRLTPPCRYRRCVRPEAARAPRELSGAARAPLGGASPLAPLRAQLIAAGAPPARPSGFARRPFGRRLGAARSRFWSHSGSVRPEGSTTRHRRVLESGTRHRGTRDQTTTKAATNRHREGFRVAAFTSAICEGRDRNSRLERGPQHGCRKRAPV